MMQISDASTNNVEKTDDAPLDVGLTLRQTREAMGLSVSDIANRIKFAPRQVEALEANDFGHLPEAAFLRGFVRSYARFLQLDEAALIAALPGDAAQQPVAKAQQVDVPYPTAQSLRRINVMWLAGALGVAMVLALFVWLSGSEPAANPSAVVVESISLPPAPIDASAVAAASAVVGASSSVVGASAVAATEVQKAEPVKAPEPAKLAKPIKTDEVKKAPEPAKAVEAKQFATMPEPKIMTASAPVAEVKTAVPLEMLKRRPLHFVFGRDAWAEVIDTNGVVLLSRTNPSGSEQWIGGPRRAPYQITIAHPASVKLYYKGKEIDLSAYAAMETAHLTVE